MLFTPSALRPQVVKIFEGVQKTLIDEEYMPLPLQQVIKQTLADQVDGTVQQIGEEAEKAVSRQHQRAARFVTQVR